MPFVNKWILIASLLMVSAIALGAFGAHGLKNRLDEYSLGVYEKAVFYHFVNTLGILFISLMPKLNILQQSQASWANLALLLGVFIFSGSLYILAISGQRWLGAITPIGGLCFILGWGYLAYAVSKSKAI